jgi:hypothetical protein
VQDAQIGLIEVNKHVAFIVLLEEGEQMHGSAIAWELYGELFNLFADSVDKLGFPFTVPDELLQEVKQLILQVLLLEELDDPPIVIDCGWVTRDLICHLLIGKLVIST